MNTILFQQLSNADRVIKDAYHHFDESDKYANKAFKTKNTLKKVSIIGGGLCLPIGLRVWEAIGTVIENVTGWDGSVPGASFTTSLFLILMICFVLIAIGAFLIYSLLYVVVGVPSLKSKAAAEYDKGISILTDNYDYLEFLDTNYWYPMATEYMARMAQTDRADTLKEALAMFDEQAHRWKTENMLSASCRLQQEQIRRLNAIQNQLRLAQFTYVVYR